MKNKAFSFFFLITLLTAGCAPTADLSSAPSFSEDPVYDAYYRAENQELTYYDVSRSGGMDSLPTVGEVNLLVVPSSLRVMKKCF
jgi:hypothetical protein